MNLNKIRGQFASVKRMQAFLILYILSQSFLLLILSRLGLGTFTELQRTFSAPEILKIFTQWRARGVMRYYEWHLVPDLIHPLIYTAALLSLLSVIMKRSHISTRWNFLLILPFAAGASDYVENILQVLFLTQGNSWITDAWVRLSATASSVKWSCAALSLFAALVMGFIPRSKAESSLTESMGKEQ